MNSPVSKKRGSSSGLWSPSTDSWGNTYSARALGRCTWALLLQNPQQVFVRGFCFCCRRVFIKILLAHVHHLTQFGYESQECIQCYFALYFEIILNYVSPGKRSTEETLRAWKRIFPCPQTYTSHFLVNYRVTRNLPPRGGRITPEHWLKQNGIFLTKGLISSSMFPQWWSLDTGSFLGCPEVHFSPHRKNLFFGLTMASDSNLVQKSRKPISNCVCVTWKILQADFCLC